jgi:hypothetical protein
MNELLWTKRYATIMKRVECALVVRYDDGEKGTIMARWGCGGRGKRIVKGARIKVYQRDNMNHVNFRMVGR